MESHLEGVIRDYDCAARMLNGQEILGHFTGPGGLKVRAPVPRNVIAFQDRNAPIRTAKLLNITELLWEVLEHKVQSRFPKPSSLKETDFSS